MKKYIALLLVLLLAVGLTACGITNDDDGGTKQTTAATKASTSAADTTTTTASASTTVIYGTASDGSTVTTVVVLPSTEAPASTTAPIVTAPSVGGSTVTTAPSSSQTTGGTQTTVTTVPAGTTTATKAPTATKPTSTTVTTRPAEPSVVLPAIGSDIDVTKKKDRIRVSAASASFNADGTIAVSLTFKNYSANWITEETDYVQYTCYDKNGNVVQKATQIMIGCIDTKKNPEKTFSFNVPATTAEVRITKSKIVYWTEWS